MERLCQMVQSSIGKKIMVAAAGLLLCGFLVTHLAGNLLLFAGEGAYNHYAKALEENPLLPAAEVALAALFILHIAVSVTVTYQNKRARPVAYESRASKGGSWPGSTTMIYSGLLVLAFLLVHLKTFRFGDASDGLFKLVMAAFANPWYSAFYVVAMAGLALHLSHGFQSAFQTLGLNHPKYTPLIKAAGLAFAVLVALGFAILPVWAYVKGGLR